jgi:hypothetical protein
LDLSLSDFPALASRAIFVLSLRDETYAALGKTELKKYATSAETAAPTESCKLLFPPDFRYCPACGDEHHY